MQQSPLLEKFRVEYAALVSVNVYNDSFAYEYWLDHEIHCFTVRYSSVALGSYFPLTSKQELNTFAVVLGVLGFARFGAVLPKVLDVSEFAQNIPPFVYDFMDKALPGVWSEHRYQLNATDFKHPKWHKGEVKDSLAIYPVFAQDAQKKLLPNARKALLTSGAGKDSLLCAQLLEQANVPYDLVTLFFNLYGDYQHQRSLFEEVTNKNEQITLHQVYFEDEYYPWLTQRMQKHGIGQRLVDKPFRVEAGETLLSSLAYVPVQIAHGCEVQIWGNEKSADLPNLVMPHTQEPIAHQWSKSLEAEQLINEFLHQLLVGVHRSSLIKPLHDVKIFKTLFEIAGDLPYTTNSCNIEKPWCGKCEKCAYVFLGFAAYGNFAQVVAAFNKNMFDDHTLLPIWEELLGLHDHISWECVGSADEAQVYFYKVWQQRLDNFATRLFEQRILQSLREQGLDDAGIAQHFDQLEQKYLTVHAEHHTLPVWLWEVIEIHTRDSL